MRHRHLLATTRRHRLILLFAALVVAAGFAAGFATNQLLTEPAAADHIEVWPDNTEVRIAARATGDGRVEVALQELRYQGVWSPLHQPAARFLPANADAGRWRTSSAIPVRTYWPPIDGADQNTGTESMFGRSAFRDERLICLVGHGDPGQDLFWDIVSFTAYHAAYMTRTNLRTRYSADGEVQAAAIRECTSDGASAIAATLANIDAVGEALREARAAGVNVMTYNSGASRSREVGAYAHLGLDDRLGGERVGQRLNESGVSGEVWCLIHEETNIGLEERCDGIEATYTGGALTRVQVHTEELLAKQAAALPDAGLDAVVALNANTSLWAMGVAGAAGLDNLFIAGFGGDQSLLAALVLGKLQFVVWDQPTVQGMLAVNLLLITDLTVGGSTLEVGGAQILIEPALIGRAETLAIVATLSPEGLAGLLQAAGITPEQAAALGIGG